MKTTILAVTTFAFFAASSLPASAKRTHSRYGNNDGNFELKSSAGIQHFWDYRPNR